MRRKKIQPGEEKTPPGRGHTVSWGVLADCVQPGTTQVIEEGRFPFRADRAALESRFPHRAFSNPIP